MIGKKLLLVLGLVCLQSALGVYRSNGMKAQFRAEIGKQFEDTKLFSSWGRGSLGSEGLYLTDSELVALFDEMIDQFSGVIRRIPFGSTS